MSLVTIALVGKSNEPLYFYCKEENAEYLHQQMIAHSALDVVEERKKRGIQNASFEMYLGQLFPIDDYKVFGSYTNTQMKLVVVCYNSISEIAGMKETMQALWSAIVAVIQNPFQETGKPLRSKKLDQLVQQIVDRHNGLNQKRRV